MASYQLVIDCAGPEVVEQFWAEALHYVIAPPPPDFALTRPEGTGFDIN